MSFSLSLPVFTLLTISLVAAGQTTERRQSEPATPEATAQLVGVVSEVNRLRKLSGGTGSEDRWQILWLHQHISERVMAVSLQVDAAIAQIDNEISRANELRSYLADRRDRTVNRLNLLSVIVGGGLSATSSGLQLSSNLNKQSAAVGIGAGTASAGLALIGIRAQRGRTSPFDFDSNMLAEVFGRPALPNSHYQEAIWAFLNAPAPNSPSALTRKQQMIQIWIQVERIDSLSSTDKIERVTSQPSELLKLTIDDLEDRAAMLRDVRARISFLKRDLGDLLTSLPPVTDPP